MALYDHIFACNAHSLDGKVPFRVGSTQVGWVRRELADRMTRWNEYFKVTDAGVEILESLGDVEVRSKALDEADTALVAQQALPRDRKEICPVMERYGDDPLMRIVRAWLESFGVKSYGVHVNGYVPGQDGHELWIGVRSQNRDVAPGKHCGWQKKPKSSTSTL